MNNFKMTVVSYEVLLAVCAIVFAVFTPTLHYSFMRPTYSFVIVVAMCTPLVWRGIWKTIYTCRYYLRDKTKIYYIHSRIYPECEFTKARDTAYKKAAANNAMPFHSIQGAKMAIRYKGYIYTVAPPGIYKHIVVMLREHNVKYIPTTESQGILTDSGTFISMDEHVKIKSEQVKI